MDPDAALRELRELVADTLRGAYAPGDEPVHQIAELFDGLDNWMVRGGALPSPWASVSRPTARVYWEGPRE